MQDLLATRVPAASALAAWVEDARSRTLALVADLGDEQLLGPRLRIVNPLLWEIGHVAWFQEKWVLRHVLGHPVHFYYDGGLLPDRSVIELEGNQYIQIDERNVRVIDQDTLDRRLAGITMVSADGRFSRALQAERFYGRLEQLVTSPARQG